MLYVILSVFIAGCLPSSCRRDESRVLFPADSLSRAVAEQTPVDTLERVWQATRSEAPGMEHPRTVRFGPEGRLYVSDTQAHRVFVFDPGGALLREIAPPDFQYPYLTGFRGDTLLVFNPAAGRIAFVLEGAIVRSVPAPPGASGEGDLQYAAASDSALFVKSVAEGSGGYLTTLNDEGSVVRTDTLAGPHWRYAGMLRTWGDSLLSLSGYRPVVHVLTTSGSLDTMALAGFDSPMLARSRSYALGEISEAPLLSASAAPSGDLLFVLNLRPGWLRIDTYGHTGRLRHVLIQQNPEYNQAFYPVDLDVRRVQGGYEIAVVSATPEPAVSVYRWAP